MNLVEVYIKEIHGVENLGKPEWANEPYVKVDMTTNCYGRVERSKQIFARSEWEATKKRGHFMA